MLLAHVMRRTRTWVLAHPEAVLSALETASITDAISRLEQGEPLPYVLGEWEFYGLLFQISPAVLIPRPETEMLVDRALKWLRTYTGPHFAADIGTGSGCIAVALAKHQADLRVTASDISSAALKIAQANIKQHKLETQIECIQSDLIPPVTARFNLICANLPYIPAKTLKRLKVLRWEPDLALRGGVEGLELIRSLVAQSPQYLAANSLLLMEIEARQGQAAFSLVSEAFPGARIEVLPDLAGHDRLLTVEISTGSPKE